jgi:pimeloyl-ACP methyl ester carboxylesterase
MVAPLRQAREAFHLKLIDPEAYLRLTQNFVGRPLNAQERQKYLDQDVGPDIALLTGLIERRPLSNADLARITTPCLLYCGQADPYHAGASECVKHMPSATFVSLPGQHGNVPTEQVLACVRQFLPEVT